MDIKRANVNVLLGKVNELLQELPGEVKAGGRFGDAEKALLKLQELFAGQDGEIDFVACKAKGPVID